MPDVLTRLFCERCGSAHSLETGNGHRLPGIDALPIVARGLRNFILSNDSIGDAIAQAREERAGTLSNRQLEAFERAFRFCMECRQYVCGDCWNDTRGRCATCAPFPQAVVVPPVLEVLVPAVPPDQPPEPDTPELAPVELPEPTGTELLVAEPVVAEPLPEPISVEPVPEPVAAVFETLPEPNAAQPVTDPILTEPADAEPVAEPVADSGPTSVTHSPAPETVPDPYAWPFAYSLPPAPGLGGVMVADPMVTSGLTQRAVAYATCPSCALPVSRAARYCRRCGTPQLAATQPAVVAPPR